MSLQRTRPMDTLQRIMSSIKHFERKLDKLQEDVNYHGHTLSELRVMVASLSSGTMMTPDTNIDSLKHPVNSTAIQYEDRYHIEEPLKMKRKNAIQAYPSKTITSSFQSQKYGVIPTKEIPYNLSSATKSTGKYARNKKVDVLRKATTHRSQKNFEKKLIKVVNRA